MSKTVSQGKLALNGGTPVRTKPFPSWPVFGKEEEENLLKVFRSGKWWYGEKVREFEAKFAEFQNAKYGVTCCNGTVALELALRTLGIQAGDEVLVPAYTFIATATAVLAMNAVPVFVDVDESTINMDLDKVEESITDKTRAIIVVHFAGLPVDMDRISELARKFNLVVLEDAAHSWGSQWKGKGTGAIGRMGTFSFQMSKNITAGEGGIILTNDKDLADLARSYANCGRVEGEQWYQSANMGGNYRLTELQAAILLAQLDRLEEQTLLREENAKYLNEQLSMIPGIEVPVRDKRVTRRSYHLYMFRYLSSEFGGVPRDKFIQALEAEGIPSSFGYLTPVYGNQCFQELKCIPGQKSLPVSYNSVCCPVAERLCKEEMVWLTHNMLLGNRDDMQTIVNAIQKIYENQKDIL